MSNATVIKESSKAVERRQKHLKRKQSEKRAQRRLQRFREEMTGDRWAALKELNEKF